MCPQWLIRAEIEAVKLTYQKIVDDDNSMQEIEHIISYATCKMDSSVKLGKEIYDFVKSKINIDLVGLMSLMP